MQSCVHGRPSGNCLICATNEQRDELRDELRQVRQEMRTAAEYQHRLAEKQLDLEMTAHWETHLTREATSKGLDPAEFIRAARQREQQEIASAQSAYEEAKGRLLGASTLRDRVSIGLLSGPVAASVRILLAVFIMLPGLWADPLGVLVALPLGSAAGAGWILHKRSGMEETARILGVPLPPPVWGMAGAAATGVAWVSVFTAGSADDSFTAAGALFFLYVPVTFVIRSFVKKNSALVAAADERVRQAATALGDAQDHLAVANRHPAVKYGLVSPVGRP